MIRTPANLRKEAERLREKAYDLTREADDLDEEADEQSKQLAVDIPAICERLLSGYLSGSATEVVLAAAAAGHEIPGFRQVAAMYGEPLP